MPSSAPSISLADLLSQSHSSNPSSPTSSNPFESDSISVEEEIARLGLGLRRKKSGKSGLEESEGRFEELSNDDQTPVDLKNDEKIREGESRGENSTGITGGVGQKKKGGNGNHGDERTADSSSSSRTTSPNRSERRSIDRQKLFKEKKAEAEMKRRLEVQEKGEIRSKVRFKSGKTSISPNSDLEVDLNAEKDEDSFKVGDQAKVKPISSPDSSKKDTSIFETSSPFKGTFKNVNREPFYEKEKGTEARYRDKGKGASIFEKESPFKGMFSKVKTPKPPTVSKPSTISQPSPSISSTSAISIPFSSQTLDLDPKAETLASKREGSNMINISKSEYETFARENLSQEVRDQLDEPTKGLSDSNPSPRNATSTATASESQPQPQSLESEEKLIFKDGEGMVPISGAFKKERLSQELAEELEREESLGTPLGGSKNEDLTSESFDVEAADDENEDGGEESGWFKKFEEQSLKTKDKEQVSEIKLNRKLTDESLMGVGSLSDEVFSETERDLLGRPRGRSLSRVEVTGNCSMGRIGDALILEKEKLKGGEAKSEPPSVAKASGSNEQPSAGEIEEMYEKLTVNSLSRVEGNPVESKKDSTLEGQDKGPEKPQSEQVYFEELKSTSQIQGPAQTSTNTPNEDSISVASQHEELRTSVKTPAQLSEIIKDQSSQDASLTFHTVQDESMDISSFRTTQFSPSEVEAGIILNLAGETMPSEIVERRMSLGSVPKDLNTIPESDSEWKSSLGSRSSRGRERGSILPEENRIGEKKVISSRRSKSVEGRVEGVDEKENENLGNEISFTHILSKDDNFQVSSTPKMSGFKISKEIYREGEGEEEEIRVKDKGLQLDELSHRLSLISDLDLGSPGVFTFTSNVERGAKNLAAKVEELQGLGLGEGEGKKDSRQVRFGSPFGGERSFEDSVDEVDRELRLSTHSTNQVRFQNQPQLSRSTASPRARSVDSVDISPTPPAPNQEDQELMSQISKENVIKSRKKSQSNLAQASGGPRSEFEQVRDQDIRDESAMNLARSYAKMHSEDYSISNDEDEGDGQFEDGSVSSTDAIENVRSSPREIDLHSLIDRAVGVASGVGHGTGSNTEESDAETLGREESFYDPTRGEPQHRDFNEVQSQHIDLDQHRFDGYEHEVNSDDLEGDDEASDGSEIWEDEPTSQLSHEYEENESESESEADEEEGEEDLNALEEGIERTQSRHSLTQTTPSQSPEAKRMPLKATPAPSRQISAILENQDGLRHIKVSDSSGSDSYDISLSPTRNSQQQRGHEPTWPEYPGLYDTGKSKAQAHSSENEIETDENSQDDMYRASNHQLSMIHNQNPRQQQLSAEVEDAELDEEEESEGELPLKQSNRIPLNSSLQKIKDRLTARGVVASDYEMMKQRRDSRKQKGRYGNPIVAPKNPNVASDVQLRRDYVSSGGKLEPLRKNRFEPEVMTLKQRRDQNLIVEYTTPFEAMREGYAERMELKKKRIEAEIRETDKELQKEIKRLRALRDRDEIKKLASGERFDFQAPVSADRTGSGSHQNLSRASRARNLKSRVRLAADSIYRPGGQVEAPEEQFDRRRGQGQEMPPGMFPGGDEENHFEELPDEEEALEDGYGPTFDAADGNQEEIEESGEVDLEEMD